MFTHRSPSPSTVPAVTIMNVAIGFVVVGAIVPILSTTYAAGVHRHVHTASVHRLQYAIVGDHIAYVHLLRFGILHVHIACVHLLQSGMSHGQAIDMCQRLALSGSAPPPEPPRPAPPLPAPPIPPPRLTRPSCLRQARGDRYADSEEDRYRQEYLDLRQENIREMEYEMEYQETMPEWRKGSFRYSDRVAREDRIQELQEILRGARNAEDRADAMI